ncbi:MAG: hypothetical protein JXR41_01325 [Bacteroidales bacterium]|nr:hypothetical protein [Bacteroidales bacterium]
MRLREKNELVRDAGNPANGTRLPKEFKRYFWDVVFDDLTIEKYPRFIAERLLNYGDLNEVNWLFSWTDREFIKTLVDTSRNLNPKTRNYWKIILTQNTD